MSDTKVDIPKVTQMLDAGWRILLFKNDIGSYTAQAMGSNPPRLCLTDDFTPEQALTRLAYKAVDGEIL